MERTLSKEASLKIGETIKLQGWVDTKRDHGKLTFIDLRDKSGKIQCVGVGKMGDLSVESVVEIAGLVKERPQNLINPNLETGHIEIEVAEYKILNETKELPIPIDSDGYEIDDEFRLKYRYLDLRRSRMQKIIKLRSDFVKELRNALHNKDFVEVETPMLTKSTKEGARDFIVPSRLNPGKFYALPQSPQQYKQLLMTAGVERYFQFARCIRDEDLRADRGFEFTQLDLEMSFVEREDVMLNVEEMVKGAVKAVGGKLKDEKFPIFDYATAIEKFGADKFDSRTQEEKEKNVLAFAWVINFPFFKKVDKKDAAEVLDSKSGWTFTHNPFSSPLPEHIEWHLNGENIDQILTTQYDLVCNGYEVGGGSIRAHKPEVLNATFKIMGYSDEEILASVGHMLEAFSLGTPPHGGIALGVDRLVVLLAGESSIKEAIAFPMTASGKTSVMDAPSEIGAELLKELHLENYLTMTVFEKIRQLFDSAGVVYTILEHAPVYTSEDAAKIRDVSLEMGAKALILFADKKPILAVVPGHKRLDFKKLKNVFNIKDLRMATPDEVKQLTTLEIGSIPPVGKAMGLESYYDEDFKTKNKVAFNAGSHTVSIIMQAKDLILIENPVILSIT